MKANNPWIDIKLFEPPIGVFVEVKRLKNRHIPEMTGRAMSLDEVVLTSVGTFYYWFDSNGSYFGGSDGRLRWRLI